MVINKEGIRKEVKPLFNICYNDLDNAYDKVSLMKKNAPIDFKKTSTMGTVITEIDEVRNEIKELDTWVAEIIDIYDDLERKNEKLLTQIYYEGTLGVKNQNLRQVAYNYDFGTFEASNREYISGYYTSGKGKVFTICYQHYESEQGRGNFFGVNWNGTCNRASEAAILSAYTDMTPDKIIQSLNNEHKDGRVIASNEYWNEFNLQINGDYFWSCGKKNVSMKEWENSETSKIEKTKVEGTYEEVLANHFQTTDGYALVWVTTTDKYAGESGKIWVSDSNPGSDTSGVHWVSVLDYRVTEDGQEQIAIADPGVAPEANLDGSGYPPVQWYNIGEFTDGISRMVLISEK